MHVTVNQVDLHMRNDHREARLSLPMNTKNKCSIRALWSARSSRKNTLSVVIVTAGSRDSPY